MKIIMLLIVSIMLTACSSQPSEQDIKKALEVSVKEENDRVKQMIAMLKQENQAPQEKVKTSNDALNDSVNQVLDTMEQMKNAVKATMGSAAPDLELMIYELVDVKKLGSCDVKKDSGSYKCKVKATVKNKAGSSTNTIDLSFVRSESGEWVVLYDDEEPQAKTEDK